MGTKQLMIKSIRIVFCPTLASLQWVWLRTRSPLLLHHTVNAWATETKQFCQQTNHLGCSDNPRRTCTGCMKVCLQPRLFIHFVWFRMMFLPWITVLPIWQKFWQRALCLRYQRFLRPLACLVFARLGVLANMKWKEGKREREREWQRGGEVGLKSGKM